jgi:hypothetical protein
VSLEFFAHFRVISTKLTSFSLSSSSSSLSSVTTTANYFFPHWLQQLRSIPVAIFYESLLEFNKQCDEMDLSVSRLLSFSFQGPNPPCQLVPSNYNSPLFCLKTMKYRTCKWYVFEVCLEQEKRTASWISTFTAPANAPLSQFRPFIDRKRHRNWFFLSEVDELSSPLSQESESSTTLFEFHSSRRLFILYF